MKRILGAVVLTMLAAVASAPVHSAQDKVTICHFPPGNPENAHTIVVAAAAVPAHLELHGDFVGECTGGPPE